MTGGSLKIGDRGRSRKMEHDPSHHAREIDITTITTTSANYY